MQQPKIGVGTLAWRQLGELHQEVEIARSRVESTLGSRAEELQPANVMFRDDGTIALVDFGSARRDADPVAKTLAGVVIGTPYYLSPEQALGGTADERSDLYSVGVMLYELLTGQRMYAAATLVALFEMHKKAPIPKLPEPFTKHQPFLEKLVAKSPELRYASAEEAFNGLMEYMMSEAERPTA